MAYATATGSERHWDATSPLDPAEQRRVLIHAFLDEESLPEEWFPRGNSISRAPTSDEILEVLEPWRPLKLRRIATEISRNQGKGDLIILRTYYGGDSDERMAEILEEDELSDAFFSPDIQWWRVLNDPELFDFGDDWERVLEILPELVGQSGFKVFRGVPAEGLAEARDSDDPVGDIQYLASIGHGPLLVADKEAFEENELRALFLDGHGNIIRDSTLKPENIFDMKMAPERGQGPETTCWQKGKVGPKYKRQGDIGRVLYPSEEA
ncbi:hypothetical protein DL765_000784 [Monosporascus sp. GIB2]|nr:hypothetical protein DL765_000784 [Monosporascus sp. GIB2]